MAVMPAAESVTHCDAAGVSASAICGMRWMYRPRGSPYAWMLAALSVGMPPASPRNRMTFLARAGSPRVVQAARAARARTVDRTARMSESQPDSQLDQPRTATRPRDPPEVGGPEIALRITER